jgi:hypothetical protein
MRNIILILIALFIISCSNDSSIISKEKSVVFNKEYSNETLLEEKFKEFYDLNILLKKYPDFKDDIEQRIKNFTSNPESIFELNDSTKIKNIQQKGALIKVSDSVQMTQVVYDLVTENSIKKDSVLAFITSSKVIIDSEEIISTKVNFTRVVIRKY